MMFSAMSIIDFDGVVSVRVYYFVAMKIIVNRQNPMDRQLVQACPRSCLDHFVIAAAFRTPCRCAVNM